MHKVFVYGTLKENRPDTHEVVAEMWNVGRFPCVKLQGSSTITGQVIQATNEQLAELDSYEGVPNLYTRQRVDAVAISDSEEDSGEVTSCWIYEWARDTGGLEAIKKWN